MVLTMRLEIGGDLIQFPQLIFLEEEDKRVIFQERTLISEKKKCSWPFNSFRRNKFSSTFCTKRNSSISCTLSGKLIQYVECL